MEEKKKNSLFFSEVVKKQKEHMNTEVVRLQLFPCSKNYTFKKGCWTCLLPLTLVTVQVVDCTLLFED